MSTNKLAIPRIIHFIAMLKENRYPNHPKLVMEMRRLDIAGAYSITQKTLQRDVAFLKGDYHAPIKYDYQQRGYFLTDREWNWDVPQLNESDLKFAAVGAKFAESIMPAPLNSNVRKSLDSLLVASENSLHETETDSLLRLVASGAGISIKPEIFAEVYKGWQTRHVLLLNYVRGIDGVAAELTVEPQILAFHEGCWYLKVKLLHASRIHYEEKNIITLAIHRISHVVLTQATFTPDNSLVSAAAHGKIFDYPQVTNIQLKAQGQGLRFIKERFSHKVLKNLKDDTQLLCLESLEEYKLVLLVFSWPGDIVVIKPVALRATVKKYANIVYKLHKGIE